MQHQKFTVDELFDVLPGSTKLSKLDLIPDGTTPVYSSDTTNNGILGYTTIQPTYIVDSESPVYVVFGDHTRTTNIATQSFCVLDNVKVLRPKTDNIYAILYICTAWRKTIPNLGYARHWSVAKTSIIELPTADGVTPDYVYMEQFMKRLYKDAALPVNSYLSSRPAVHSGYPLSVAYKDFKLHELFTSVNGDIDIQRSHISDTGEFVVTSGVDNRGILGRTDMPAKIIESHTLTIDMFGNCFYRNFPYKMVTHARVFALIPKFQGMSDNVGLFFAAHLDKYKLIYSYNNMCSWSKIQEDTIRLPVVASGDIDLVYIEQYISTLRQQVENNINVLIAPICAEHTT